MTTQKLIEELKKADPDGTAEVVVNNAPIYFVENLPAYWDGHMQVLKQDLSNQFYNIRGVKITGKGQKVRLNIMNIEDIISEDPEAEIDLSELDGFQLKSWEAIIDRYREDSRESKNNDGDDD